MLIAVSVFVYPQVTQKEVPVNKSLKYIENNSTNLFKNPGFENGRKLANNWIASNWLEENKTVGTASFTLIKEEKTNRSMQHMYYKGQDGDEGKGMLQIYQPVDGNFSGKILRFSLYIDGELKKTPTVIGIEGFDEVGNYISEKDVYIEDIPQYYEVFYRCPPETKWVAAYVQCQEINKRSLISLYMDDARLSIESSENTLLPKDKPDQWKKFWASFSWILLSIPLVAIFSELGILIKGMSKQYEFSGKRTEDYKILVPIWGNMKYLENIEYLSPYAEKVVLCTTGDEDEKFYTDLKKTTEQYGFEIFIDHPSKDFKGRKGNQRTTSGLMRDTIIKNALHVMNSKYVVTLDADSTTAENISILVGEIEEKRWDLVSIKIVPHNLKKTWLTQLQVFEYNTAMRFRFLCPWLVSGACHGGKTEVLRDVMNRHSLFFQGNDVETGLLAKSLNYNVGHIPFVVLTNVPDNLYAWFRQRLAWAGGEFRLFIINFKFIFKHPLFWLYGAMITICLFPLRWLSLIDISLKLLSVLGIYALLIILVHWKEKNRTLLIMPLYSLLNSLVMTPLGIIYYFYMADKDNNMGIIKATRKNK